LTGKSRRAATGRDIVAHIDGSIRSLRAAYAVAHLAFDKEPL
jgi:hypothetical protein